MLEVKSPAKINLYLKILSKLRNGYHEIESAFQLIDLNDTIKFYPSKNGIDISCNKNIKREDNIIYKAANALNVYTGEKNSIKVDLVKKIPSGAGLGGGSSNAAMTLLSLNNLWSLSLSKRELLDIGKKLGADVPFFVNGENAFVKGIGEKIIKKESIKKNIVVIYPNIYCSTRDMYKDYDSSKEYSTEDPQNSFWVVVKKQFPEINRFYEQNIDDMDLCLSGSGSCMFVLYDNKEELKKILKIIPSKWRFFLTKPLQYMPLAMEL